MKKILIIGETPLAATRYGNVIRELAARLNSRGYNVAAMGYNYSGWPIKDNSINYKIYPWVGTPDIPHNALDVLKEFKPEILLLVGAPVLFTWIKKIPKEVRKKYHIAIHTGFKSKPLSKFMQEIYSSCDSIIVNTKYEYEIIGNAVKDKNIFKINPGINISNLQTDDNKGDGIFRVITVARDCPKIDFASALKAFGIVAKEDLPIIFGIFADAAQLNIWNIRDMMDVYGLQEKCTVMNPRPEINFGFKSMGDIYSTANLMVLPSQEDIIDITELEGAFCNVPMLLSNEYRTKEFIEDYKQMNFLEKTDIFVGPPDNTRYRVFDSEEIAGKIITSFHNYLSKGKILPQKVFLKKMEKHDWSYIINDWAETLDRL